MRLIYRVFPKLTSQKHPGFARPMNKPVLTRTGHRSNQTEMPRTGSHGFEETQLPAHADAAHSVEPARQIQIQILKLKGTMTTSKPWGIPAFGTFVSPSHQEWQENITNVLSASLRGAVGRSGRASGKIVGLRHREAGSFACRLAHV